MDAPAKDAAILFNINDSWVDDSFESTNSPVGG